MYGMHLSRARVVPRTMREGYVSDTSTSWVDVLDHLDVPEIEKEYLVILEDNEHLGTKSLDIRIS